MDHLPVTRPLAQWIIGGILLASLLILFLALRLPKAGTPQPAARRSPSKRFGLVFIAVIPILSAAMMWPVMRPSPHDLRNWRSFVPEWLVQGFVLVGLADAPLTPINPDVSGDGRVDILDIQQVEACWKLAPGTSACPSVLDVNHDDAINVVDISLVAEAWEQPFTHLAESSPMNGETSVGVLRETILRFSAPLDPAGVVESNFAVQFGGQSIARRLYLSADQKTVTIFYDQVLPASARVRVTIDGDAMADARGYAIDVDGDGVLGGTGIIDFDTLTLTTIPGTIVCGRVFASELEPVPGGGSINVPLEGARITVDGSSGAMDAFSDSQGNFCLDPAPAGSFFVHIDGREATNPIPAGSYYPYVGKQWQSTPGQNTNIGDIFLPLVPDDTLQNVSATQPVTITFAPSVLVQHPEFASAEIVVPANNLFANNGTRGGQVGMAPVPPDRLPSPLPPDLNFPVVITVQTDGAENFDLPVPVCFPNLPDPTSGQPLPPGSKSALWSFNHDTGNWDIVGPMTVSPDGTVVCSDPGSGVISPGWHGTQPGASASGAPVENGCKPSPGGNPIEEIACRLARPAYCETKFGNSCVVTCADYTDACMAACVNSCNISRVQCLASSDCPFEPPDGEGSGASSSALCSIPALSTDPQTTNLGQCIDDPAVIENPSAPSAAQGLHYYAIENRTTEAIVRRGTAGSNGLVLSQPVLLASNTAYRIHVLQAESSRVGYLDFSTLANSSRNVLPVISVGPPTSPDSDDDGLHDYAEYIMGTNIEDPDSDDDGISDGAEVRQGQNPLDGIPAATGIIATADTPGTAVDVCALDGIAAVADSQAGVSVFNVFSGMDPTIIAQVNTPGNATAVACAADRIAVADGATGLAVIDTSDPPAASILHQVNLSGPINAVVAGGGLAYAGVSTGKVAAVDMTSGAVLASLNLPAGVQDVALHGEYLYALTIGRLYAINLLTFQVTGDANSPGSTGVGGRRLRLFVGSGVAYAVHTRGYNTISLNDPAHPVLIANGNTQQFGWKHIVANGSGLGVAAVGPNSTNDGLHNVSLYDLSDPTQTNVFITEFPTPGLAAAVSIYDGQAFVADSQSGLQVINYLAYDNQGVPPTISLSTNFAPGVAEEGQIMRVSANVDDDVQVRNVEFYVDGVRQVTDGNFPFEHRFVTPLMAQQPSFTVQARASDTGGNVAETGVMTMSLIADATPPQVTHTSPPDGSRFGLTTLTTLSASFSEPINPATLTADTFLLWSAGPDGQPGTPDDVPVGGGQRSFSSDTNTTFLSFATPLPSEHYRAVLTAGITDLAGNPLATSQAWTFSVGFPVYWDGGGNGTLWSDPLNWSIDALPGPNDIVIIEVAGTVTVTHASGATNILSLQSQEPIRLTGGTLTISDQATIDNRFTLSSGTLDGTGTVTVNGALVWTGGSMAGSGRTVANSTLSLGGTTTQVLDVRTLDIAGAATWSGDENTYVGNGAVVNLLPGGSFDIQNDHTFAYLGGQRGVFNNAGAVTKSAGAGASRFDIAFNNSGLVNIQAGTLQLNFGGSSSGPFQVQSGATLDLGGNGHTLEATATVANAGAVRFSSSTTTVNGAFSGAGTTAASGGTATFIGAFTANGSAVISGGGLVFNTPSGVTLPTLTLSNGTLGGTATVTVNGALVWTGGSMTGSGRTVANSTLSLGGTTTQVLDVRTLDIAGAATWSGDENTYVGNGAVVNLLPGGSFDIQNDHNFAYLGGQHGVFNNAGAVTKSAGAGASRFDIAFNNSGSVNVQAGVFQINQGGGSNSGVVDIAGGATLDINGPYTNAVTGVIQGTGTLDIRNAQLTNNGTIAPTVIILQ